MDCKKVGALLLKLRKEKNLTQKQLASLMNISDKTVSKWERGLGCPDVSLLREVSNILGVNIEKLLCGELEANIKDAGNIKKLRFFRCPVCGNILTSTSDAQISCCGRKLTPLETQLSNENHKLCVQEADDEYYITFSHEMSKNHYICFVAFVESDRVLMVRLYPEQGGELRFPRLRGGKFYFCCNEHGLFLND